MLWTYLHRPANAIVKKIDVILVDSRATGRGRPTLTLVVVVRKNLDLLNLSEQIALDRAQWKMGFMQPIATDRDQG